MNSILLREFSQDLSCSSCITAGYVYAFADGINKEIGSNIAATGFCCRENVDGTVFCGDDEKMYAHLHKVTEITTARTNKVRDMYDDLRSLTMSGSHRTHANDLYI